MGKRSYGVLVGGGEEVDKTSKHSKHYLLYNKLHVLYIILSTLVGITYFQGAIRLVIGAWAMYWSRSVSLWKVIYNLQYMWLRQSRTAVWGEMQYMKRIEACHC